MSLEKISKEPFLRRKMTHANRMLGVIALDTMLLSGAEMYVRITEGTDTNQYFVPAMVAHAAAASWMYVEKRIAQTKLGGIVKLGKPEYKQQEYDE